jgi:hypothetical protein
MDKIKIFCDKILTNILFMKNVIMGNTYHVPHRFKLCVFHEDYALVEMLSNDIFPSMFKERRGGTHRHKFLTSCIKNNLPFQSLMFIYCISVYILRFLFIQDFFFHEVPCWLTSRCNLTVADLPFGPGPCSNGCHS